MASRSSGRFASRSSVSASRRIMGIVNGTTNYILTRMTESGDVLLRGAWPRPRARLCGGATRPRTSRATTPERRPPSSPRWRSVPRVVAGDVYHEGISRRHRDRHRVRRPPRLRRQAARRGRAVVGERARSRCGSTPRWCPWTHPLAGVRESFNAVFVEGEAVGDLMFYGRGAGGSPTASRGPRRPDRRRHEPAARARTPRSARSAKAVIRPIDELASEYYVNLEWPTGPACCGPGRRGVRRHGVSIRSMEQEGLGDEARLDLHHPRGARGRRAGDAPRPPRARCRSTRIGSVLRVIGERDAP